MDMYKFANMPVSPGAITGKSYENGKAKLGSFNPAQMGTEERSGKISESVGSDSLNGWVKKNVNDIEVTEGRL